jgi:hypothetical protein
MGRPAKQLSEYFRCMVAAAHLADELGVARSGFALARWFEREQDLPRESVDEKAWRRFLSGQQPQYSRLQKVFEAVPSVQSFYLHPFWDAVSLSCSEKNGMQILESYGWDGRQHDYQWFEGNSGMSLLDQLACLTAMLGHPWSPYSPGEIGRRLCVVFVEIIREGIWQSFCSDLLLVIKARFVVVAGTAIGLTEPEVTYAQQFWHIVRQDFFTQEPSAGAEAWCAWREAVFCLGWQDRDLFMAYLEHRSSATENDRTGLARRVYNKVRAKMYRAMREHRRRTASLFDCCLHGV